MKYHHFVLIASFVFSASAALSNVLDAVLDTVYVIGAPLTVATGLLQPLQLLFFNSSYSYRHVGRNQSDTEDLEKKRRCENSMNKTTVTPDQSPGINQFLLPLRSLIPIIPKPSPSDVEAAEKIVKMMTTTAALPAFTTFANLLASQLNASSTSMFSQTPFGNTNHGQEKSIPDQTSNQNSTPSLRSQKNDASLANDGKTDPVPVIEAPSPSQQTLASAITNAAIPVLPGPIQFLVDGLDVKPPDSSLTPYSSALMDSEISAVHATTHALINRSTLPITQADCWKALNLFAVGISNSYGRVPSRSTVAINQEFITSLIFDKYPFTPISYASLALDVLSFVNTTQHFRCPPREAYRTESLAKMLFLRFSDAAESFAKVSFDYFCVESVHFVKPAAFEKRHSGDQIDDLSTEDGATFFNLPISRFRTPSIGSVLQSASSISELLLQPNSDKNHHTEQIINDEEEEEANIQISTFQQTLSEAIKESLEIIDYYEHLSGSELFLDLTLKSSEDAINLLRAATVSVGPIGHELLDIASRDYKQLRGSKLPPIANRRTTREDDPNNNFLLNRYNYGLPFMSKSKKLRLQMMGLPGMFDISKVRHRPSIVV